MAVLWSARPGFALVISEVMYHPVEDPTTGDETLEFIEIYNNRAVSEDLSGWAFTNGIEYTFDPNTTLGPKAYMVIARDPNAVFAAYSLAGVLGPYTGKLNNDGERIDLSNAAGMIVLSLRYNDASPWPVSPDGTGHSLILAKLGGDPERADSWSPSAYLGGTPGFPDQTQAESADPTVITLVDAGSSGRYFKGTQEPSPGAGGAPTTAWTQVGFDDNPATTGWLDGANGYGYSNNAAELEYIGTVLSDMSGNYISIYARLRFTLTSAQVASFTQLLAEVHYDDGYVLYLNGTRVADSGSIIGNPPAYNASGGTAAEPPVASVDLTANRSLLLVGENVLAIQAHNATLAGSSDGFGCAVLRAIVTQPEAGDDVNARIVINELLANSDAAPGADWIELYNPGPTAVSLNNVYLSDDRLNLLQYKVPDGVALQPGRFWAVRQGTAPDAFHFGLDFAGETLYVTAATSDAQPTAIRVLDAIRYGNMAPDVTFGRCPDGSDSLDCLASATLGVSNSDRLIRDIVINEIMYHHAARDDRFEYVELYNRGESTISLEGWAFTDGIDYTFPRDATIAPGGYLVVAKDPNFLVAVYENLVLAENLFGPYEGGLDDHSERIRLSYPMEQQNPDSGKIEEYMVTADDVTYFDGGRWPAWADGMGASLELRDPRSDNDTPGAWADSDESGKTQWQPFSFTIEGVDGRYTHDAASIFDLMLLNAGEALLDDLECVIGSSNRITNNGFESGAASWRILGNHCRSFVTTEDRYSGASALHLIATGHGDPGANRINQSIAGVGGTSVTFRGWARWLRGSRFLLLRTTRELSPVRPPRPAHAFELNMPLDLGTPGSRNTAFVANRGPDILDVKHSPTLPKGGESIVVTARVLDNDGVASVTLYHRAEGSGTFAAVPMVDDGSVDVEVAGDQVYTFAITGATAGTVRAFYIEASDGTAS
ncbi:MAG: lamin tail domain-containing protein, partial [Phycisphaerales bacterium]